MIEYIRTAYKIPAARPFAMRYAQGFFIYTTLWLISAMIPMPKRFILWILALSIDLITTILIGRNHVQLAPNIFYLPERMGTLIVP